MKLSKRAHSPYPWEDMSEKLLTINDLIINLVDPPIEDVVFMKYHSKLQSVIQALQDYTNNMKLRHPKGSNETF